MDAIDGAPTILHVWVFARLGEGVNWYSGACPTGRGPEWRLRAKHRAASVTVLLQGLWQPTGTFQPPEPPFHSQRMPIVRIAAECSRKGPYVDRPATPS